MRLPSVSVFGRLWKRSPDVFSSSAFGHGPFARKIQTRKQAEDRLQAQLSSIERLYQFADKVSRAQGLDEVCDAAVEGIVEIVSAQRASILMFDEHDVMHFKAWRGLSSAYRAAVDGHSPWTADCAKPSPITVEDALSDASLGHLRDVVAAEGIRALAFIPLVYRGRLLGKFMVYHDQPHRFSAEELQLAMTIAHHVAFGMARAQADAAIAKALQREQTARTEADAARAQAERANAAKDEFLAMLAHELRNPLGVITTALGLLERESISEPLYDRARAAIRRQSEHLARLLDDLLDVARITNGQAQVQAVPVDLRSVIELGLENHRHRFEAKRQRLRASLPDRPVTVLGDAVRLQQICGNILSNASKYSSDGGTISVALATEGDSGVLRVRDNGIGIAPDRLEWVFELFTQATPTLARTEGGLGIGLTVAKRLVELHNGRIRANSEGLGRGTEIVVELPLAASDIVPAIAAPAVVKPTPRRILVIEDNEDGRQMLVAALELHDYQVLEAATGRAGIEQAKRHRPDVVLIDIGLPDIDGYAVAEELHHNVSAEMCLIALTGYGSPADRARSEDVGFRAHLLKPVDLAQLIGVVESSA